MCGATCSSVQDCACRSLLCVPTYVTSSVLVRQMPPVISLHCCRVWLAPSRIRISLAFVGCKADMVLCRKLPEKFGQLLSEDQLKQIEELGLLADLDDQVNYTTTWRTTCPASACHRLPTFTGFCSFVTASQLCSVQCSCMRSCGAALSQHDTSLCGYTSACCFVCHACLCQAVADLLVSADSIPRSNTLQ